MANFSKDDLARMGLTRDPNTGIYVKKTVPTSTTKEREFGAGRSFVGKIFIPGNVPSLKNSKRILFRNGTTKGAVYCAMNGNSVIPFIGSSLLVEAYKRDTATYYEGYRDEFLKAVSGFSKPLIVEFVFIRSSKRAFDFNNANHMVTDMMKLYDWIEDDDMSNILPIPKLTAPHTYLAAKAAGVWITPKQKLI